MNNDIIVTDVQIFHNDCRYNHNKTNKSSWLITKRLQNKLNVLQEFCSGWCMEINIDKTKIIYTDKTLTEDFVIGIHIIECI